MNVRVWWNGLSRAYQNAVVLLAFDSVLLLGLVCGIAPLQAAWEAITGFLPNIYQGIALQLVALLRGVSPGSMIVSGVVLDTVTTFLSLLSMHLVVGFGLGFLFDHTQRSRLWGFVNCFVLIMVLFTIHFFLIVAAYL